ncbi:hypothetical protein BGW80DRAFT_1439788 [Lactifluus volemus]|nr:hypothetical protein BGW80DRAFT_1439788 [Lactifluus volemus]
MNFEDAERDAYLILSLSWSVWPSSRIEANRTVVPIAVLYIPLMHTPSRRTIAYTTIEYTLTRPAQVPPIFLFVINTCLDANDLKVLRDAIVVNLSLLPPFASVGLITFGTMAQVHEIGYAECSKSHVLRGGKEYTPKQIQDMLGLKPSSPSARPTYCMPPQTFGAARLLPSVSQCEFKLRGILDDKWPLLSTGVALSVAVRLLETTFPNTGARIMLFVGGPATEGPGMVVMNHDIDRDPVKHFKRASEIGLAKRASNNGHAIDLFAGSLPNSTNGVIVLSDSFSTSTFKQSFLRVFNKGDQGNLAMGFNATFDVQTTKELKVSGLIGQAISDRKKPACAWELNTISPRTAEAQGSRSLIQFVTHHQHSTGQMRLHVATIARNFAEAGSPGIAASIDQEAAAVLVAHIAVVKADLNDSPDVLRWLVCMLTRLCPPSFRLADNFSIYPQLMFHLRHGQFLQVFNKTPPQPVLLDSISIRHDVILLLNTFFRVLIFHGEMVAPHNPPVQIVFELT